MSQNRITVPADFADALVSSEYSSFIDPSTDIYSRLLGKWRLKMIDYNPENHSQRESMGYWYFSRTLEGRAIQDVLVSPGFEERQSSSSLIGNRYGNTFRMMDPQTHQWSIDWFNPVSGIHNHLIARVEDERIIQETQETNGTMMRWIFEDIIENSFHWIGENSTNQGKTWALSAEFYGTRIN